MRRLCAWDSNPGLKAQMNPLSYSGTPTLKLLNTWCHRGGNANIWAITVPLTQILFIKYSREVSIFLIK